MKQYILCVVVGLLYGAWPILAKRSGAQPLWIAFGVALLTFAVIALMGNKGLSNIPSTRTLWFILAGGIMNGVATWYYGQLLGTPGWNVSTLVPISMMILLVTSSVGGFTFLGEPMSAQKVAGLLLALPAIWLMTR